MAARAATSGARAARKALRVRTVFDDRASAASRAYFGEAARVARTKFRVDATRAHAVAVTAPARWQETPLRRAAESAARGPARPQVPAAHATKLARAGRAAH